MSEPSRTDAASLWRRVEELGLAVVGLATVVYGGWFLYIALGLGTETSSDTELRVLAGAIGTATTIAGVLTLARRREDLVGGILGAFTAAAFTLGATQLIQPDESWRVMYPAAIFGGLLFGYLAFRGAFRRRRTS
jgi:hypothetical protein